MQKNIYKIILKLFFTGLAFVLIYSANAQNPFTSGNLVVLQVGDGTAAGTSASSAVFLKAFNTDSLNQATYTDSIAIPSTGASIRLTTSGSATSEGQISLSADSTKIVIGGYDADPATSGIASTTAAAVKRVIDTVGILGIPGRAVSTNTQYSANNLRSATKGVNEDYWGAGGNSGSYYFGNTTTAAAVQTTNTNTRIIKSMNGNLYYTTASGTILGLYKLSGQPTASATPSSMIVTGTGSSPYSFAVNASETIAYIADDRSAGSGGGVQRWVYASSAWSVADTLLAGTGAGGGARGLTVDFSGIYPVIYTTTVDNRLVKIIDSGTVTTTWFTLATAPTNTSFRSVCFAPKCPPAPSVSVAPTSPLCNGDITGAVTTTVTGGSAPFTYSWTGPSSFTSTAQNISNVAAGTYNLTVVSLGGCKVLKTAVVTQPSTISISLSSNSPICVGDTLKLNSSPAGGTGTLTVSWTGPSFANSTTSPRIPAAQVVNAGKYKITVTDANNCKANDSVTTVINTSLVVNAGNDTIICPGVNLTLNAGAAGSTYLWNTGATTQTVTVSSAAKYYVTVTNSQGCKGGDTVLVAVDTLPKVALGNDTSICFGTHLTLNAKNTGGTYLWNTGNTTQTITVDTMSTYSVIVSTVHGCSASDTIAVSIDSLPKADNIVMSQMASNIFLFTVSNPRFATSYLWLFGDGGTGTGSYYYYHYSTAGTYTVKLIMSNSCGSDTLSVSANPTGIEHLNSGNAGLMLYPNPARQGETIQFGGPVSGTVYDIAGHKLFDIKNERFVETINLNRGSYFIRTSDNAYARFVIE